MNALGIPELSEKEMAKHVEEEDFFQIRRTKKKVCE